MTRALAGKYRIGLAVPFAQFQKLLEEGNALQDYMSHINHPNAAGHEIIAQEVMQ